MICGLKDQMIMTLLHARSSLVSASHSRPPWSTSSAKVSVVGLLDAVAIGIVAAGGVVLADLCASFCWRLHCPPEVVTAEAIPSGWDVYVASLWWDE